ncbi:hypothetical protein Y032_0123g1112 [Ancylostoma ceylanicum]|uniref:G-protein coupled receptors family 1 profile domain-containing protein n=1 Tax=Ancylostoma ceylanicum TaxID=53326 RepID=A0A016T9D0_9BILA|nr:hypothetical protein Y032_0123g1112 [Ancylostoma ceylanicum]
MLFWYASIYGQLQLAINRLIAITSPVLYNSIFSPRRTLQMLIFFWTLSFVHIIVYFWDGCDFTFNVPSMVWDYATTSCGEIISFYLDFVHGTTLCIAIIILDTVTFIGIYKQVQKLSGSTTGQHDLNMLRKNVRLYIQACLQAGCFALMICSFHILSRLVKTNWQTFFLTTFVWETAHALDGVIIFMFYESFRKVLCRPSCLQRKNLKGNTITKGTMFSTSRWLF